ncbi:MAG: hypothetical protein ACYDHY_07665 [Acidiferrobacterales bacterium]
MKAGQLREMIEVIVREELQKQLPGLIAATLAEGFLKKVVAEAMGSRPVAKPVSRRPSLAETLEPADSFQEELDMRNEEDEPPQPLRNVDKAIYQKSPLIHDKQKNEVVQRLVKGNSALASIFEGVKPIDDPTTPPAAIELVPDKMVEMYAAHADKMAEMAGIAGPVQNRGPIPLTEAQEMRRLERQRAALDRPANGGSRPQPRPVVTEQRTVRVMPELPKVLAQSNDGTMFDPFAPISAKDFVD